MCAHVQCGLGHPAVESRGLKTEIKKEGLSQFQREVSQGQAGVRGLGSRGTLFEVVELLPEVAHLSVHVSLLQRLLLEPRHHILVAVQLLVNATVRVQFVLRKSQNTGVKTRALIIVEVASP